MAETQGLDIKLKLRNFQSPNLFMQIKKMFHFTGNETWWNFQLVAETQDKTWQSCSSWKMHELEVLCENMPTPLQWIMFS
jgi:hypothetical protein